MKGFAEYRPDEARRPADAVISVRGALSGDLEACARLIVTRTGGSASERRERLLGDLENPDRYVAVACADEKVIGYGGVIRHEALPGMPADTAPSGYYLIGLIVAPEWRRHGIGDLLTADRLRWTAERADEVYTFVNLSNAAILDLHQRFRFEEVTRTFSFPNAPLEAGTCVLLRAPLNG
ncbi:ribosomal protein S18 acetylase RimI-like enzyme [Kribbella voronezhensis]|uniref:Ribosomal protein S18 acetylase RimI-like enzyme n=1 Tax=Kribbella voronezhensis TaxID=2512212 RepID=A0A4R7SXJ1_9ACTN|nr:GNAT family N-acetyltransferase [Kribbella voronezhensis]TDU84082.1 ribosomal protein S18 acetylase RimI-like enzyme [Kribbella voronezhensis]